MPSPGAAPGDRNSRGAAIASGTAADVANRENGRPIERSSGRIHRESTGYLIAIFGDKILQHRRWCLHPHQAAIEAGEALDLRAATLGDGLKSQTCGSKETAVSLRIRK